MSLIKKLMIAGLIMAVIGGGIVFYLFNMPHRDVQSEKAFAELTVQELMDEYSKDANAAVNKYMDEEGESKVLVISGTVDNVVQDGKGQSVVRLVQEGAAVGVNCTFLESATEKALALKKGDQVKIKGFITSFGEYDEDLDLADDSSLEKCDLVQ